MSNDDWSRTENAYQSVLPGGCGPVQVGEKAESGSFTGCNLPQDAALKADGWEWRCNTDGNRSREMVDTYTDLGFEVQLVPIKLDGLSDACGGCKEMLERFHALYTRKK
jgi:hypothetical protein